MFASAAALTFPPLMEPPMRMTSFTSGTREGSFWIASAMLVRGPTGTRVISCGTDEFDDQVGAEARVHFALAGRQLDVGEAVFPVPELGGDKFLEERMLCAGSDGNVATIGERNHAEGVFQALLGGGVAGDDGDGADVQL